MTSSHTPVDAFDISTLLPKKLQKYKGESDEDFNNYKHDLDYAYRIGDGSLITSIRKEREAKIDAASQLREYNRRLQRRQLQFHQHDQRVLQRRLQQRQLNPHQPEPPVNHPPPNRVDRHPPNNLPPNNNRVDRHPHNPPSNRVAHRPSNPPPNQVERRTNNPPVSPPSSSKNPISCHIRFKTNASKSPRRSQRFPQRVQEQGIVHPRCRRSGRTANMKTITLDGIVKQAGECKVPAATVEADNNISNSNAIEEVTIAVQQQMDNAQQIMNHPTDTQHQLDDEEEQQNESNNDNDEQQSQRMTTSTMPVAQTDSGNNEQSTTQPEAQPTTPQSHHHNQTQSQTQQMMRHHSPLTKVNGKGLWRSWKRNFQSKLLALMDLIDNSLDAAAVVGSRKKLLLGGSKKSNSGDNSNFIGRVHVYPDKLHQTTNNQNSTITTGIILLNNSHRSIRPLQHILEVYNSSKTHSGSEHIGENGVGLKQGAATLSDLTFVLVKKRNRRGNVDVDVVMDNVLEEEEEEGVIELGLIAESLQREEGCCLPAFTFPISNDGGKQDITKLLSNPNKAEIAACVTQYGNGSLECGIDRLSKHFHEMCFGGTFGNDDNVFCLILDRVDYGHLPTTEDKCFELLKDLRMEIPRFYLHMSSTFDFRIGRGTVPFDYWQQRLVELSSITVLMNHSSYWHEYKPESDPGAYKLRVLIGFDRFRINNRESGKEGSLYIYSRESGRLIKCMPDGRGYLGLDNTGSMYCQGLTIIIDDIGGHLPLNPTKQAIAFAEQTNGAKHEENLITLVGILVKTYFGHHINKFKKSRTLLTQTIKEFGNDGVQIDNMKDIDSSELTTFEYKTTSRVHSGRKKILIDKKVALKVKAGRDTRFLLIPPRRPIPIPPLQVVDTRRDDQNRSRKRRADEMMITTGRERVAPPNAFIPNNVVVENNSLPAAGMNGYNNTVPQPTAHFEPLARPNMRANNVQRQLVLNQSSTQPTAASTGTSTRGKTLNHLNAMQRNTLQQQQQLQQQQVTQQPIIQQPLLNNQLAGQSQQSSNTSDSPSIQDRYTALLILYRGQCQENVARKEELRTMNAEIQELQTENERLEDVAVAKNEELQAKDAKIQELTTENDQLKDDVTALKQQLIEIVQNRAEVETSEMI